MTKDYKTRNNRCRWNLIFNLIILMIIPLPIYTYHILPSMVYQILIGSIQAIFIIFWLFVVFNAIINSCKLEKYNPDERTTLTSRFHYVFDISYYKEPMELLHQNIECILDQKNIDIMNDLTISVGLEAKTPDVFERQKLLAETYKNKCFHFHTNIHELKQNEIPGKCSNSNSSSRAVIKTLTKDLNVPMDNIIFTTLDTDTLIHPYYCASLNDENVITKENKDVSIFQAPIMYNWNLDRSNCITHITSITRSFLMLGALIPFSINTMSVFTFSANLLSASDYIHPMYYMDDIIRLVRMMIATKQSIGIKMIPVPIVNGPTSGNTYFNEIYEWYIQAHRWTVGTAEVFHYFVIKSKNIPLFARIKWCICFIFYYLAILCCSTVYNVVIGVFTAVYIKEDLMIKTAQYYVCGFFYILFTIIYIINWVNKRSIQPKCEENIRCETNILHWIFAPIVLLLYSVVEIIAIFEVGIKGNKVCVHQQKVSAKVALPVSNQKYIKVTAITMDEREEEEALMIRTV